MDWDARARELAPQYGLDPDLVSAVIGQESSGNPNARSPKNAQGLMQLIPATAARFGVTNAFDPEQNLHGGMKYLRWLLDKFGGNVPLALAGYNAGENAVLKYGGIPPYPETQNYVKKIVGRLGAPDVRMASVAAGPGEVSDVTDRTPTGNPITGEMDMPNASLPPYYGTHIELPPSSNDPLTNMAQNPWLQMGLGILSTNNIGQGMQRGLLGAAQARRSLQPRMQQFVQGNDVVQGFRMPDGSFREVSRGPRWPAQGQASQPNLIGKVDPEAYTMESLAAFQQTGDYSSLVPKEGTGGDITLGGVGQGQAILTDPQTGLPRIASLPGSKQEIELRTGRDKIVTAIANIRRLQELIEKHGTEWFGQRAGEMANLYGDIQTAVRLAQEMGAPQAEELRQLEKQLPNPTNFTLSPGFKAKARGAYNEAARKMEAAVKFLDQRYSTEIYGGQPPSGGSAPLTPAERAELEQYRQQRTGGF